MDETRTRRRNSQQRAEQSKFSKAKEAQRRSGWIGRGGAATNSAQGYARIGKQTNRDYGADAPGPSETDGSRTFGDVRGIWVGNKVQKGRAYQRGGRASTGAKRP